MLNTSRPTFTTSDLMIQSLFLLLRLQRELGILLITASLLLFPWFYDRNPPNGYSPLVMGWEFVTEGWESIIVGFICFWLAYGLSYLLPAKYVFLSLVPFGYACFLYFCVYAGFVIGMVRGFHGGLSFIDKRYPAAYGMDINALGIFLLAIGIYVTGICRKYLREELT